MPEDVSVAAPQAAEAVAPVSAPAETSSAPVSDVDAGVAKVAEFYAGQAPTEPTVDPANPEAAAKPAAPAPEAPASPAAFTDQHRQYAEERWGIAPETLNAFGDAIRFDKFYNSVAQEVLANAQKAGWTPPTGTTVAQTPAQQNGAAPKPNVQAIGMDDWTFKLPELDPEQFDPKYVEMMNGLTTHYGSKIGTVAQQVLGMQQVMTNINQQFAELKEQREYDQFERFRQSSNGTFDDVFGKGSAYEVDGRTREGKAIKATMEYARDLSNVYKRQGLPVPPTATLYQQAAAALFPKQAQTSAAKAVSEQSKKRTFTARPNAVPPPRKLTLDEQREEFARRADEIIRSRTG